MSKFIQKKQIIFCKSMWAYLLKIIFYFKINYCIFYKIYTVIEVKNTKNKKFFFQQIILIFAVYSESIYKLIFINFLSDPLEQGYI